MLRASVWKRTGKAWDVAKSRRRLPIERSEAAVNCMRGSATRLSRYGWFPQARGLALGLYSTRPHHCTVRWRGLGDICAAAIHLLYSSAAARSRRRQMLRLSTVSAAAGKDNASSC